MTDQNLWKTAGEYDAARRLTREGVSVSTNTGQEAPTICPQCGMRGIGRFCNNCGSPLMNDDESIPGEIQSKFTTPLIDLFSFLKAMWLILVSPTTFFKSYTSGLPPLSQLTFPLAGSGSSHRQSRRRSCGRFRAWPWLLDWQRLSRFWRNGHGASRASASVCSACRWNRWPRTLIGI